MGAAPPVGRRGGGTSGKAATAEGAGHRVRSGFGRWAASFFTSPPSRRAASTAKTASAASIPVAGNERGNRSATASPKACAVRRLDGPSCGRQPSSRTPRINMGVWADRPSTASSGRRSRRTWSTARKAS